MEIPTIDINELNKELREIIGTYLENPKDKENLEKAQMIHKGYMNAMAVLPKAQRDAVNALIFIGVQLKPIPTEKELREMLDALIDESKA